MAKKFLTPIQSTVSTGTAPLVVASTTAVANLNSDLLDGQHGSFYAPIASPTFTGTVAIPTLSLTTSDTATAASHYMVETGTDGIVRPKTLANARTEIVTTAAVNSAAATTVGTITSGTWQGSVISATYIDTAIARLASPTFTGTPTSPTAAVTTNTTQVATTAFVNAEIANDAIGKSGLQVITQAAGSTINTAGQVNTLQILQPTAQADAFIAFHIAGDYAAHLGVDGTTNDLSYGGWSAGAVKYRVWHAGNQSTLLANTALTGTPTAPTATAGTNTTQLATTAFVTTENNLKANLSGATFTGTVTGVSPTAAGSTGFRKTTMSTSAPTGGLDGDVWLVYA